jgi:triacylglycerol lipase
VEAMKLRALGMLGAVWLVGCGSEAGGDPSQPPTEAVSGQKPPATSPADPQPTAAPAEPEGLGAPYPVVLLHGMGGFGKLEAGPIEITYFKDVVVDLSKSGESVFVTLAPPYETSEVRAEAIAKQIDGILKQTGKKKVNLVGHSQGGLDARVLASPAGLGYGDRIASVTTVATPHLGSKIADATLGILKYLPENVVDSLTSELLKLVQKTAYELQTDPKLRAQLTELSEKHMTEVFNPKYKDDANVVYMSYGGRTNLRNGIGACDDGVYPNDPWKLDAAQGPLIATALFLEEGKFKVNDGLVTVESSKWGKFQQCVAADHLKEVGQLGPLAATFDHIALFRDIVGRVRKAGL